MKVNKKVYAMLRTPSSIAHRDVVLRRRAIPVVVDGFRVATRLLLLLLLLLLLQMKANKKR
jgi:hypothetical protein